jgi:hypothetical protein
VDATAVAGFVSPRSWKNEQGRKITLHPFLIILEAETPIKKRKVWLPYFHLEEGNKVIKKYGQWAPSMDIDLFADLISKAHKAGYVELTEAL